MRRFNVVSVAAASVAVLAGCMNTGGVGLTPPSGMAPAQSLVVPPDVRPNLQRAVENSHVVRPNCCAQQKTVFISDAFGGTLFTGAIYMFDYVKGTFLGQVAPPPEGFSEVQGGCTDNNGNVYFANTALSTIDEYNHGGKYVATLADPGEYPVGCSYDPSSGELAVSNIINTSGGAGSLSFYVNGKLKNVTTVPELFRVYFLAYEGNTGTLWLDGWNSSGVAILLKFLHGQFKVVVIHGATFKFPGGLAWSAKTRYMNVGDQGAFSGPAIYEINDSGDVKGEVYLQCPQSSGICDPVDFAIKGPGLVADTARFAYPAGGAPILQYLPPNGYNQPIGAAISSNKGG